MGRPTKKNVLTTVGRLFNVNMAFIFNMKKVLIKKLKQSAEWLN